MAASIGVGANGVLEYNCLTRSSKRAALPCRRATVRRFLLVDPLGDARSRSRHGDRELGGTGKVRPHGAVGAQWELPGVVARGNQSHA